MTFFKREQVIRWMALSCVIAMIVAGISFPVIEIMGIDELGPSDALGGGDSEAKIGGGVRGSSKGPIHPGAAYALLIVATLEACLILCARFLPIRVRIRPMELALPVTARQIVFERWLAVFLGLAIPFLAASLVWAWMIRMHGDYGTYASVVGLGLLALAASTLLLFAYRPSAAVISTAEAILISLAAGAIAIAPAWFAGTPISTALAVGAVALALGGFLWTRLPAGTLADDPKVQGTETAGAASPSLGVRALGPINWTLVRSAFLKPGVIALTVLGALGIALVPFPNPMFEIYIPIAMVALPLRLGLNALHGLDPLPMDRARLVNVIGLPALAILVAAMAASRLTSEEPRTRDTLTPGVAVLKRSERGIGLESDYQLHVRVPAQFWRMGFSKGGACVTAPWGESTDLARHKLLWGLPLAAHCPYDVGPENTGRFLVWQTRRALSAVHGYTGTDFDVHSAWFEGLDLDAPLADQSIDEFQYGEWGAGTFGRTPRISNSMGLAALLAILIWGTTSLVLFRRRPKASPRKGRTQWMNRDAAFFVVIGTPIVAWVALGGTDTAIKPILKARLLMALNGALGSSPLLWLVLCAVVAASFYLLVRRRARSTEVPPLSVSRWTRSTSPIF